MKRMWEDFFTPPDRKVFEASGYAAPMGFGERPQPILKSIERWRNSCGEEAWVAIGVIRRLIDACHRMKLSVFYSTNTGRADGFDAGAWRWKNSRELEDADKEIKGNEIVAAIAPSPQDVVIYKTKPSVFFGTPLLSFLIDLKVDTLMVCGVSTSGCVRATVIEAFSNNLRVQVIEDACFDRNEVSHAVNPADMNAKYGDVIPSATALAHIETVPAGLFDLLPTGIPTKATA